MTEYRVIHTDLLTGIRYGELPVSSVSYTDTLNSPGSMETVVPVKSARTNIDPASLQSGRTGLFVERDSVLQWGGILWTQQIDPENNYVTLGAEGFHSYLRCRYLRDTKNYVGVDQTAMIADLVSYAMTAYPASDVGITATAPATGVLRERHFYGYELRNLGDLIEQEAAVIDGFDFRYVPYRDETGRLRVQFTPQYPNSGRPTPHIFKLGANAVLMAGQVDGKSMANTAFAVGGGSGSAQPRAVASDPSVGVWPLLERVDTYSDVSGLDALTGKAQAALQVGRRPIVLPTVVVQPDSDPPLGAYAVGDIVHVSGTYGLFSVEDDYKITEMTVTANEDDGEQITLTLATLGAFTSGS